MSEEINNELKQEELIEEEISAEEILEKEETSEDKIIKLEKDLKDCEDKYLRVHADFENIKKRLEKEKYQVIE